MAKTTARELFKQARMVEKWDGEFTEANLGGCYYNHVPEIDGYSVDWKRNERVLVRPVGEKNYDGRRFWRLAAVFLDDKPVMLVQNAGREGDDHAKRFVVDGVAYREMVGYLMSIYEEPEIDANSDVISLDEERQDLDSFYNDDLAHVTAHPGYGYCC